MRKSIIMACVLMLAFCTCGCERILKKKVNKIHSVNENENYDTDVSESPDNEDLEVVVKLSQVHKNIEDMLPRIQTSYNKFLMAQATGDVSSASSAVMELEIQRRQCMIYWDEYINTAKKLQNGRNEVIQEATHKRQQMQNAFEQMVRRTRY